MKDEHFLSSGWYGWRWQEEKSWGGFGVEVERSGHVGKVRVKEILQGDHKTTLVLVQKVLLNSLAHLAIWCLDSNFMFLDFTAWLSVLIKCGILIFSKCSREVLYLWFKWWIRFSFVTVHVGYWFIKYSISLP